MIKIIVIGIAVCMLGAVLKKFSEELVLPVNALYLAMALLVIFSSVKNISDEIYGLLSELDYGKELVSVMLKGVFICLITKLSADACMQSGNKMIADIIELCGRAMLIILSFPYISSVIKISLAFIE